MNEQEHMTVLYVFCTVMLVFSITTYVALLWYVLGLVHSGLFTWPFFAECLSWIIGNSMEKVALDSCCS